MTYEKIYIEEYKIKNKNDPTFNEPFKGGLIKNYVIQDMIDAICEMNINTKKYTIHLEEDGKIEEDLESKNKNINLFENNYKTITVNSENTNNNIINDKCKENQK